MRKTYRKKNVKQYWVDRWEAVEADNAMQNKSKYPLSCSLSILKNIEKEDVRILEAGCGTGRLLRFFHQKNTIK